MKPRKLTRTQLECLMALGERASVGAAWSDQWDLAGARFATPTFTALIARGLVAEHVNRNAWGWYESAYSITAAGAAIFAASV